MSDENTAHQESVSSDLVVDPAWTPLGATPRTWEQQVYYALGGHTPLYEASKHGLNDFEFRHGPCTMESVVDVARNGVDTYLEVQDTLHHGRREKGETEDEFFGRIGAYHSDLIFAMRMLGIAPTHPYADQAREVLKQLYPLLDESLFQVECALSLGHLREETVLRELFSLLTGNYPFSEADFEQMPQLTRLNFRSMTVHMHEYQWPEIPHLLWRWAPKQVVPALRRALDMLVQAERLAAYERQYRGPLNHWQYQNDLVYALGRLGAFDALAGIEPSDVFRKYAPRDESLHHVPRPDMVVDGERQRIRALVWRVQMSFAAVGYKYAPRGRIERFSLAPDLQRDIEHLLEEQFGMASAERNEALAAYEQEWLSGTSEEHYREWLWENAAATR